MTILVTVWIFMFPLHFWACVRVNRTTKILVSAKLGCPLNYALYGSHTEEYQLYTCRFGYIHAYTYIPARTCRIYVTPYCYRRLSHTLFSNMPFFTITIIIHLSSAHFLSLPLSPKSVENYAVPLKYIEAIDKLRRPKTKTGRR